MEGNKIGGSVVRACPGWCVGKSMRCGRRKLVCLLGLCSSEAGRGPEEDAQARQGEAARWGGESQAWQPLKEGGVPSDQWLLVPAAGPWLALCLGVALGAGAMALWAGCCGAEELRYLLAVSRLTCPP